MSGIRIAAIACGVLLTTCVAAPAAGPSLSPSSGVASPSPTATATATAAAIATASRPLIPLPSFATIVAPSGTVVWAFVAASRLFRSTDRGETWQERALPPGPAPALAFVDDREGFALVPGSPAVQCGGPMGSLSHTVDGGLTWERLSPSGVADAQCKDTIAFIDGRHGYLGTYDPNSAPLIYRTTDAGLTWTASRPLPDPPGFRTVAGGRSLRIGTIVGFGSVLLASARANSPTVGGLYAFRSTDDGATWSYASTAPVFNRDLVFVSADRWLQIGQPDDSKETTDGGVTWHAFSTTYQQAAPIAPAMVFGDPEVGYATVRGQIQRTVDGGVRWTVLRTPGTF